MWAASDPLPLQSRGSCVASGLGPPHVWEHLGILLLWPESHYLERGEWHLGEDTWAHRPRLLRYRECGRSGWAGPCTGRGWSSLAPFPSWCSLFIPWICLVFLLSVRSRGKALRPKANLKQIKKGKKKTWCIFSFLSLFILSTGLYSQIIVLLFLLFFINVVLYWFQMYVIMIQYFYPLLRAHHNKYTLNPLYLSHPVLLFVKVDYSLWSYDSRRWWVF